MITKERRNRGTGGVWTLTMTHGGDEAEFSRQVKEVFDSIDYYASPSISRWVKDDGTAVAEITYYGLD